MKRIFIRSLFVYTNYYTLRTLLRCIIELFRVYDTPATTEPAFAAGRGSIAGIEIFRFYENEIDRTYIVVLYIYLDVITIAFRL